MAVIKGETSNGIEEEVGYTQVEGRQGKLEESESDEVGFRVGGRHRESGESESGKSDKDESEEVGYKVGGRQGEGAGRFLLAAKTFQPGQPVMMESPLVQVQQGMYTTRSLGAPPGPNF